MSSVPGSWKARIPPLGAPSVPFLQEAVPGGLPQSPAGTSGGPGSFSKGSGSEGTDQGHVRQRALTGQEAETQVAKALMVTETLDRTRNQSLLGFTV